MAWIHPDAAAYLRARWTRPDGDRWLRGDAERRMSPEELRLERLNHPEEKSGPVPMPAPASDSAAERQARSARLSAIWLLRAAQVQIAMLRLDLALRRKAGFKEDQPRHPKDTPLGGRWSGGSGGLPLGPPPKIPDERPPNNREKNVLLKEIARYLKQAIRASAPIRGFLAVYEAVSWLDTDRPYVEAYRDPPKSMEELREGALTRKRGYEVHHIVEKASAAEDGFPKSLIDSSENRVRVPMIAHWQITG